MIPPDPFEEIAAVADAVLYEGYLLYPYRASAQKNRVRWQWGVLMPSGFGTDSGEVCHQRVDVLVEPRGDDATLRVRVRFLHQERRTVLDADGREVDELAVGDARHLTFDEGAPEHVDAEFAFPELRAGATIPITRPATRSVEDLMHPDGRPAGRVVRTREPISASALLTVDDVAGPYATLRLSLEVRNSAPAPPGTGRDDALRTALIGTHTMLAVAPGSFVSPTDPPEWARTLVGDCASENVWAQLAGPEERSDLLLCSPIILGDHARIAPESGINLFDGTENDEILTLRTLALTEAEKAEARATDPRAAEIIDAVEALPPEMMDRLHGAIRSLRGPSGTTDEGIPTFVTPSDSDAGSACPSAADPRLRDARPGADRSVVPLGSDSPESAPAGSTPWWDPAADTSVDPDTDSVLVGGTAVARGSAVVLRPGRGTDAQDRFLAGMRATVQAVVHDVDGGTHVAVSVDDDPATEMQLAHGRFRYFRPDELEPAADPTRDERGIRTVHAHERHTRAAGPPELAPDERGIRDAHAHERHSRAAGGNGTAATPRVLVAGIGNVFLGDDGFGVEVAQRLLARGGLPDGVQVVDVGIRGVDLAYRMLDGWDGVLLVDALHRDGPPGTLYRLEHRYDGPPRDPALGPDTTGVQVDGHDMSPDVVLGLLRELAAAVDAPDPVGRVLVLGCEPESIEEGIGLSAPVTAAVEPALAVVDELVHVLDTREGAHP